MAEPDYYGAVGSFAAINAVGIAFLYYVGWRLWSEYDLPALLVIAAVLQVLSAALLGLVATSDPGFLPRQMQAFAVGPQNVVPLSGIEGLQPPRADVIVSGVLAKLKFCPTCYIIRPPRASHCAKCDMCVERFDHHCPWVGNCIGKRNYLRFFLFLWVLTAYSGFVSVSSLVQCLLTLSDRSAEEMLSREAPAVVIGSLALTVRTKQVFLFALGLLTYHIVLIAVNQTTYERIKASNRTRRPYDLGTTLANCAEMLMPPTQSLFPLKLHFPAVNYLSRMIETSTKSLLFSSEVPRNSTEAPKSELQRFATGQSTRLASREEARRTRKVSPMHAVAEETDEIHPESGRQISIASSQH